MSAVYRGCSLGDALVDALDVLVTEGKIDGPLAGRVMQSYDEVMAVRLVHRGGGDDLHNASSNTPHSWFRDEQETMEKKVTGKGTLKGKLDVYRYIDNIWTFVVSKATLRSASHQAVPKKDEHEDDVEGTVKLTVVDAKLLKLMKGK